LCIGDRCASQHGNRMPTACQTLDSLSACVKHAALFVVNVANPPNEAGLQRVAV
jgi:hypothetical protein